MKRTEWHLPGRPARIHGRQLAGTAGAIGLAWTAAYFLDPDLGRRRRRMTIDQVAGAVRGAWRGLGRINRAVGAGISGRLQWLRHGFTSKPPTDDATIAHKVETELFRRAWVPKGRINVNAEHGTVILRGVAEHPEDIKRIESIVRSIDGVRDVRSLLHLPDTPAPTA